MTLRPLLVGLGAVGLFVIVSCASMPRAPMPRQAPVGPEPTTVDEAQADIDRWGAQLGLSPVPTTTSSGAGPGAGPGRDPASPTAAPPSPSPQSAPPTTGVDRPSAGGDSADRTSDASSSASECATPCRAIASMRRSVAALCRIAGDEDPRCVAARRTLDEGERRVARCGC